MAMKVVGHCAPECGVSVQGEVEASSRDFVHRFTLPKGTEQLVRERRTEVEGVHLATFGPDEHEWKIPCPLCRGRILVAKVAKLGA